LRIINTPARGISALTVERAMEWSIEQKCSLWHTLQADDFLKNLSARAVGSVGEFVAFLDSYETRVHEPLADFSAVMTKLIEEIKYADDLRRACKTGEEALGRENNIRDMLRDLAQFQQRKPNEGLRGFLDEVTLDQSNEDDGDLEKKRGVTLITLHAAKGLEFPHVYLIGLEEGLLPHDRSKVEGTIDEERRLLYVGITRAMRTLTLTFCRDRIKFGSPMPCHPSSFIKELAAEHIEHVDLAKLLSTPVAETTAKSRFAQMRAAVGQS
jgi:superfamily I DNA/RNA helicase